MNMFWADEGIYNLPPVNVTGSGTSYIQAERGLNPTVFLKLFFLLFITFVI